MAQDTLNSSNMLDNVTTSGNRVDLEPFPEHFGDFDALGYNGEALFSGLSSSTVLKSLQNLCISIGYTQ